MDLKTKIFPLCVGVLLFSVFLCAAIYAWTEPINPAPAGNVSAPINTGGVAQAKSGGLNLGSLNVSGNVGIGTTNPIRKLDVAGYVNGQFGLCMNNDCRDSWSSVSGPWTISGNNIYNSNTGNIGIGTATPASKLDVAGGNIISEQVLYARHIDGKNWNNNDIVGDLYLQYNNNSNNTLINSRGGNVGIGTASPNAKFNVVGGANFSRDNTGECCSSGDFTLSLAENTAGTGKKAGIQFHNGGISEGQLRLDNGTNGRELKAYSYQDNMDVHATGYVQGDQGLCIGADCRNAWPSSGAGINTPQTCPVGQWMVGIKKNAANEIVIDCTGGGTPPISVVGEKRIFVTSNAYPGSSIPDDAAADGLCNSAATASGINAGGAHYHALVYLGGRSSSSVLPNTATSFINWSHTNGTWTKNIIAGGASDFFTNEGAGYIRTSILYNQFGNPAPGVNVWTNFKPNGTGGLLQLWVGNGSGGVTSSNSGHPCPSCNWQLGQGCSLRQFGPCLEQRTMPGPIRTDSFYWYGNSSRADIGWSFAGAYDPNATHSNCSIVAGVSGTSCMNNESAALYCVEQ